MMVSFRQTRLQTNDLFPHIYYNCGMSICGNNKMDIILLKHQRKYNGFVK